MKANGASALRLPDEGPKGIIKKIKKGMSYKDLLLLQAKLGVDKETLAALLKISPRTYERRRLEGKIDSQETDRALRLGRIIQRTVEMYDGDEGAAKAWLRQSVPALEGLKPLELIETEAGAVLVENLIGRIEAGVFS
ncbi:MAG: type II toxin-antitoxin system Xre/ParS family antitoxin [Rectinemataceae bacterium]